jgi:hypothetical protein
MRSTGYPVEGRFERLSRNWVTWPPVMFPRSADALARGLVGMVKSTAQTCRQVSLRAGLLAGPAGITERRWWPTDVPGDAGPSTGRPASA